MTNPPKGAGKSSKGASLGNKEISQPVTRATVYRPRNFGLSDLQNFDFGYWAGNVVTGNGTLGLLGMPYFQSGNQLGVKNEVSGVPIRPADQNYGVTYLTDIFQHFTVVEYKDIRLHYVASVGTGTNGTLVFAPIMGGILAIPVTGVQPPPAYGQILGIPGAVGVPPYQSVDLDLTKHIQKVTNGNYISADNPGTAVSTPSILQICPVSFVVAGSTTGLTPGPVTLGHVFITGRCHLRSFLGGLTVGAPTLRALSASKPSSDSLSAPQTKEAASCDVKGICKPIASTPPTSTPSESTSKVPSGKSDLKTFVQDDYTKECDRLNIPEKYRWFPSAHLVAPDGTCVPCGKKHDIPRMSDDEVWEHMKACKAPLRRQESGDVDRRASDASWKSDG